MKNWDWYQIWEWYHIWNCEGITNGSCKHKNEIHKNKYYMRSNSKHKIQIHKNKYYMRSNSKHKIQIHQNKYYIHIQHNKYELDNSCQFLPRRRLNKLRTRLVDVPLPLLRLVDGPSWLLPMLHSSIKKKLQVKIYLIAII